MQALFHLSYSPVRRVSLAAYQAVSAIATGPVESGRPRRFTGRVQFGIVRQIGVMRL